MAETPKKNTLVGSNYTTPDLVAKVTGKAKYAEDFRAEGMLFAKLLLSPMPHARVRSIDSSAALAIEKCGLHRRIALGVLVRLGASPRRLVLGGRPCAARPIGHCSSGVTSIQSPTAAGSTARWACSPDSTRRPGCR